MDTEEKITYIENIINFASSGTLQHMASIKKELYREVKPEFKNAGFMRKKKEEKLDSALRFFLLHYFLFNAIIFLDNFKGKETDYIANQLMLRYRDGVFGGKFHIILKELKNVYSENGNDLEYFTYRVSEELTGTKGGFYVIEIVMLLGDLVPPFFNDLNDNIYIERQ